MEAIIWCTVHQQDLSKCTDENCFKMESNIPTEKQYYKKVLISSEGHPVEFGFYLTEIGPLLFEDGKWKPIYHDKMPEVDYTPTYWLKPYSPKEEAVEFAEWVRKNYARCNDPYYMKYGERGGKLYMASTLYDKYKQEKA